MVYLFFPLVFTPACWLWCCLLHTRRPGATESVGFGSAANGISGPETLTVFLITEFSHLLE